MTTIWARNQHCLGRNGRNGRNLTPIFGWKQHSDEGGRQPSCITTAAVPHNGGLNRAATVASKQPRPPYNPSQARPRLRRKRNAY